MADRPVLTKEKLKDTDRDVEECTAEELSLDGIRQRAHAFNHLFAANGGIKGYEVQAIEVLLAEIERLERLCGLRDTDEAYRCTECGAWHLRRATSEPEVTP